MPAVAIVQPQSLTLTLVQIFLGLTADGLMICYLKQKVANFPNLSLYVL